MSHLPDIVQPFARQSTCVTIDGRAILIEGAPGTGKSSLALALIDRGAVLIGDDSIMLEVIQGALIAHPHPMTQGLFEVRNLGILPFPYAENAPVSLLITLNHNAPRFIDAAQKALIAGIELPHVCLWPETECLALKAELALTHYGRPKL